MVINWLKKTFSNNLQTRQPKSINNISDSNDMIEFLTERGEQVFLEKEEYRKSVLPYNLKLSWNEPQMLFDIIHSALKDGFYKDILEASNRLLEIDQKHERSHCIASIVLMKNQRALEARTLLENYIESYGPSAIILTNLAKTYADDSTMKDILWQAIKLDSNLDSALGIWLSLVHKQESEEGYEKGLREVMKLPIAEAL